PANPSDTWQFTNGITFTFPTNQVIPANGLVLVVPIDPATFQTRYNVPAGVPIYGPYTGKLDNAGEAGELSRPPPPQPALTVPYIVVDHVPYHPTAPWPTPPDGGGPSLSRLVPAAYGNDPANWVAGPNGGTPGVPNFAVNQAPVVSAGAAQIITL